MAGTAATTPATGAPAASAPASSVGGPGAGGTPAAWWPAASIVSSFLVDSCPSSSEWYDVHVFVCLNIFCDVMEFYVVMSQPSENPLPTDVDAADGMMLKFIMFKVGEQVVQEDLWTGHVKKPIND
ncbi:hypothetical protein E2562_021263 [Oryza meyeriana var. granulata]|uniref:Uncharacterized protein n=1 Tax=Oryza meyeriana var. granulata TaxID=110450 RepID=A0A6G1DYV2_9ORYZ|nr:hypothetical protein E2562_021263 [Oryza meyeriana var. granulata]